MKNSDYKTYVDKMTPNSPMLKDLIWAFCVGGIICTIGQAFFNLYEYLGISEECVPMLTSSTMVLLSALFTGFGIYDNIAKHAGAGTIVPITGFANAITSPALEFKSEGYILGLAVKMFTVAGPVLVYGITSGFFAGVIYYLLSL